MKKQYFIPQVETMPLFNANALCAGSGAAPTPSESFSIGGGIEPEHAL